MVSFRKSLLLMALLVVVTGVAAAQVTTPLTCTANAGVPPLVRAEAIADEVGQVTIECRGGVRAAEGTLLPTINVQIFLNTNLTSRIYASGSTQQGSEALLLIDEPAPAIQRLCPDINTGCPAAASYDGLGNERTYAGADYVVGSTTYRGYNIFRAIHGRQTVQGLENSVTWLGIPFNPPGTAGVRTLRLTNVRANASSLAVFGPLGIPSTISMAISISGTAALPLANPQLTVAFVQPGLLFTADSALTIPQCERATYTYNIRYQERFGTAFRVRGANSDGVSNQNQPGQIYNTESMFTHTDLFGTMSGASYGVASAGTRLQARFTGIPTGLSITLTPQASTLTLSNVSGFSSGNTLSISGQAGTAVWEVIGANPNQIENITIQVSITWSSGTTPGLGTATIRGDYNPLSTVFTASTSAAVPRFVESNNDLGRFSVTPCQTNLLYPFVSNQAGFDTGVVVSNTSLDPFGTVTQEGDCTIHYYGKTAAGATLVDRFTTPSIIKAGEQLVFTLSAGGTNSVPATAGFQGYLIIRCNFQYAHGFAFVSDLGAQRLAMGYLPLVMDGAISTLPRTGVRSEPLNQ
jgi:hypothetical protein